MKLVRWVMALALTGLGASLISMAYAGRRLEKYRDPVVASLAELEQGSPPPSVHVTLDQHWEVRSLFGYSYRTKAPNDPDDFCFLIAASDTPFVRALSASKSGDPAEAMRVAPIARPVLLVTDRYDSLSAFPEENVPVGPLTGVLKRPGSAHVACNPILSDLGLDRRAYLMIEEEADYSPLSVPFFPFTLLGFLCLVTAPVPVFLARRSDRMAAPAVSLPDFVGHSFSNAPPASAGTVVTAPPPRFSAPPASNYPRTGSAPPPDLDLSPGASVMVRRGAQQLPAFVVMVEGGRCRCEFPDGQQAWVLLNDIRNA